LNFSLEEYMKRRTLTFTAILLAALAMGMHLAHVLELGPKLGWDITLYLPVQTSLYKLFGTIGPVLEIGALIAISILAYRLRGQGRIFKFTALSAGMIVLALITWILFVLPANGHITQWQVDVFPDDWTRWRDQWQYGQAGIFFLHLIGFSALISSVIGELPES
jgi:hypothetical protein